MAEQQHQRQMHLVACCHEALPSAELLLLLTACRGCDNTVCFQGKPSACRTEGMMEA